MEQIVVDVVGFQAFQLLLKDFFHAIHGLDQIMGQFCGNIYSVPALIPAQDLAHGGLAARINVGGIQIVDPARNGGHHLFFRLVDVNSAAFCGKPHASVAKNRDVVPLFVLPVLHKPPSCLSNCVLPILLAITVKVNTENKILSPSCQKV